MFVTFKQRIQERRKKLDDAQAAYDAESVTLDGHREWQDKLEHVKSASVLRESAGKYTADPAVGLRGNVASIQQVFQGQCLPEPLAAPLRARKQTLSGNCKQAGNEKEQKL